MYFKKLSDWRPLLKTSWHAVKYDDISLRWYSIVEIKTNGRKL